MKTNNPIVNVATISQAYNLDTVKLSDLFEGIASCFHSSRHDAVMSPFERTLILQDYILSQPVEGFKALGQQSLFLKPSKALEEAIKSSPYVGLECSYVWLQAVNDGRIMVKLSMESGSSSGFTYDLYAGFITPEDLEAHKNMLLAKDGDHFINIGKH